MAASKTLIWGENGQREHGSVGIGWQVYTVKSEFAIVWVNFRQWDEEEQTKVKA